MYLRAVSLEAALLCVFTDSLKILIFAYFKESL